MKTRKRRILDGIGKPALLCLFLYSVFPATSFAGPPPVITAQPLDAVVVYGGTATFSVTASSGTALSYQWYKRELVLIFWVDTELTGQTSSTLTITGVGNSDQGIYFVKVTNAGGTVSSRYANLDAVNDRAPVARNDSYTTQEDVRLTIAAPGVLANDTDGDGDTLTARLVSTVSHGSLTLNPNGSFTYTPNTNYNGSDSFTYAAHDGLVTGNVATVTINLAPVNDVPRARDDSTNTLEDVSVTIAVLVNDSDPEGAPLTITGTSTTNGTAVISGSDIVFTPATNFNGTVVFNYTISDGTNSATANVTVTITPVNDAPVANDDTYTTSRDVTPTVSSPGVLANDVDADGDPLTAVLVDNVSHGSLALNPDGSFTYTPGSNYYGSDSFTYRAMDGTVAGNVATVNLKIPHNGPLTLNSQEMTASGFKMQLSGPTATAYVIEASSDLMNWTPISTNSAVNGFVEFTDATASNYAVRFYRASVR